MNVSRSEPFRQMSSAMRQQFDSLNLAATKGDRSAANVALGQALNACVACHDSYRMRLLNDPASAGSMLADRGRTGSPPLAAAPTFRVWFTVLVLWIVSQTG